MPCRGCGSGAVAVGSSPAPAVRSDVISPVTAAPGGKTWRLPEVIDLPEPDSPTSPSASRLRSETRLWMTGCRPPPMRSSTWRSETSSSGDAGSSCHRPPSDRGFGRRQACPSAATAITAADRQRDGGARRPRERGERPNLELIGAASSDPVTNLGDARSVCVGPRHVPEQAVDLRLGLPVWPPRTGGRRPLQSDARLADDRIGELVIGPVLGSPAQRGNARSARRHVASSPPTRPPLGLADPEHLVRLRVGRARAETGIICSTTAAPASRPTRPARTPSARASGLSTRSCRWWPRPTAARPGWPGRWAGTPRPRSTRRCCCGGGWALTSRLPSGAADDRQAILEIGGTRGRTSRRTSHPPSTRSPGQGASRPCCRPQRGAGHAHAIAVGRRTAGSRRRPTRACDGAATLVAQRTPRPPLLDVSGPPCGARDRRRAPIRSSTSCRFRSAPARRWGWSASRAPASR